jgi:hypothetical protein
VVCFVVDPLRASSSCPQRRYRWSTCDPPHKQLLVRLGVGGVLHCQSLLGIISSSLSTHNPPCEQGLTMVVVGAGRLRCPIIIIVYYLAKKRLLAMKKMKQALKKTCQWPKRHRLTSLGPLLCLLLVVPSSPTVSSLCCRFIWPGGGVAVVSLF